MSVIEVSKGETLRVAVMHASRSVVGGQSSGGGVYEKSLAALFDRLEGLGAIEVLHFIPGRTGIFPKNSRPNGPNIRQYRASIFEKVCSALPGSLLSRLIIKLGLLRTQKALQLEAVHLAYIPSASSMALRLANIPYVFTAWDNGHRELPGFPEVWAANTWLKRENTLFFSVARASHVVVESPLTGRKLEHNYGLATERWTSIGLLPEIRETVPAESEIEFPYFIYPAVKWAHKNHVTLLRAMALLGHESKQLKLVFTGLDGGHGNTIWSEVAKLGLEDRIVDLGFVPRERLLGLIAHSRALLMPSLLGPVNLPPLEALQLGTPAIISDIHHFDPELSSRMRVVGATDAGEWASAMASVLSSKFRPTPIAFGGNEELETLHQVLVKVAQEISVFHTGFGVGSKST